MTTERRADPTGSLSLIERLEAQVATKADREATELRIERAQAVAEEAKTIALAAKSRADRPHECARPEVIEGIRQEVASMKGAISSTNIRVGETKDKASSAVNKALWAMVLFLVTTGAGVVFTYGKLVMQVEAHDTSIRDVRDTVKAMATEVRAAEVRRQEREDRNWAAMREAVGVLTARDDLGVRGARDLATQDALRAMGNHAQAQAAPVTPGE